jgi:ribosomal protein S9
MEPTMNTFKKMAIVLTVVAGGFTVQTMADRLELHQSLSAALAVGPVF